MNAQAIAIDFADRLSRERALTEDETDKVCAVLSMRTKRLHRLWTAKDDREILRLFRRGRNAVEVAAIVDRTAFAVRSRKRDLRARNNSKLQLESNNGEG